MALNFFVLFIISALSTTSCFGGIIHAVPAAYSVPYASSYNAHVINHAIAAPLAAAPFIAAPAPLAIAAHAPVAVARAPVGVAAPVAYNAFYGK